MLPTADEGAGTPDWPRILSLARHAESGGIDSLWVCDHMINNAPARPASGVHEATAILAAVAATTSGVELGTLVIASSFRAPVLLAKMAATIDAISGGRLVLGLGCGWNDAEHAAFGFAVDHRVGRFEEALGAIEPLVRGERVTVAGRWTRLTDAVLVPAPVRRIPILVAAAGPRMLSLTARYADAWNTAWYGWPNDRFRKRRAELWSACDAHGRDPASIEVTVGIELDTSETPDESGPQKNLRATRDALTSAFEAWAAEGVDHLQIEAGPVDERVVDAVLDARQALDA